ncbi:WhiB family transcriptional regulator [Streptomyces zagrosensis]|uniref:Transcriptional regulator WhiB n=1 Tax=Streptomyces zagrosensis TaxID=1042984 RepID=A0A7W9QB70_9ACTN|nr:WhiB family transcriptional regulator [Streptomyces zagrosensis]MBB5937043.1 WhiB family redox-sensing transcriptional regulator [Streptomyces zagrosensis]
MPEGHADRWRHAACVDEDPELFFPVGATSPRTLQQEQEAKAVCARCPIIDMCRDWAVATGQTHGVWGGTSEQERAVLLRRARREKAR